MHRQLMRFARSRGFTILGAQLVMAVRSIACDSLLASPGVAVNTGTYAARLSSAPEPTTELRDEFDFCRFLAAVHAAIPAGRLRRMFDEMVDFNGWSSRFDLQIQNITITTIYHTATSRLGLH